MNRWDRPVPPADKDDAVLYGAADLAVLGTLSELKRKARKVTKLVGTGKAPGDGYAKGQDIDTRPDFAEELIRRGWARPIDPKSDPYELVAMLRDEPIVHRKSNVEDPDLGLPASAGSAKLRAIREADAPKAAKEPKVEESSDEAPKVAAPGLKTKDVPPLGKGGSKK